MATDTAGGTLAASTQRTILGILLAILWAGLGATVPSVLGEGLLGTVALIVLTVVLGAAIVALLIEGIREGQKE
ncbi:hypothetical protein [Halorhabdus salina]|uniref:hypothetical protein n=1 Tax=Halorhabdus salina TaxID=2750670 RepID=UPI0015EEC745|nr:hypothetical protein [Halorhabdus salina]